MPTQMTNVVIGPDDRRIITNTTMSPYRSICYMLVRRSDGQWYSGTGTVISDYCVLTARHILLNAQEVRFYPAQRGYRDKPFGEYIANWWQSAQGNSFDTDIAAVFTRSPIGVPALALDYGNPPGYVTLVGYPGITHGSNTDGQLWSSGGEVLDINEQTIDHNADSSGGNSGGPVLTSRNNVIGVHVSGSRHTNENTAVMLSAHQSQIEFWRNWKPEEHRNPSIEAAQVISGPYLSRDHWDYHTQLGECAYEVRNIRGQVGLAVAPHKSETSWGYWQTKSSMKVLEKGWYQLFGRVLYENYNEGVNHIPTSRLRVNSSDFRSFGMGSVKMPPGSSEGLISCQFYSDGQTPIIIFYDVYGVDIRACWSSLTDLSLEAL